MSYLDDLIDSALALHRANKLAEAEAAYRRALEQSPDHPDATHFLGIVLVQSGQIEEGVALLEKSVQLAPNAAPYFFNLGKALQDIRRPDGAVAAFRRAVELDPKLIEAWQHLGSMLRTQGFLDEAIAAFASGAKVNPIGPCAGSLFYTLWFSPRYAPEQIFAEHRRWAERFADPLTRAAAPHANDRNPDRRLRIGYVSSDFWEHVIGVYIEPVIANHDRERFEIFCYADGIKRDGLSERLKSSVDHWREISALDHDQAAQLIRSDQIDILIDLASHTGTHRLLTFARKPAPVQITYLAYPATTGIVAMDYRITDHYLDPVGATESLHTEKLIRLPGSYWVYPPRADLPEVNALPALSNGFITFGSLNVFAKINASVLETWSQILAAVPGSRLKVLLPGLVGNNRHAPGLFASRGIDPSRVDFIDFQARSKYLQTYHEIDINLDPFPYGGHTTSLDAAFMGVPIVTLTGRAPTARAGVSLNEQLKLPDLIARTPGEYVQKAVSLARDLDRLTGLRGELRARFQSSRLADPKSLTRDLEEIYRSAWQGFVKGERG